LNGGDEYGRWQDGSRNEKAVLWTNSVTHSFGSSYSGQAKAHATDDWKCGCEYGHRQDRSRGEKADIRTESGAERFG